MSGTVDLLVRIWSVEESEEWVERRKGIWREEETGRRERKGERERKEGVKGREGEGGREKGRVRERERERGRERKLTTILVMYSSNSPQDMDLEPSSAGTHSHITVTYLSRTSQESPSSEGDDDLMDSPQRRAGYRYR